MSNESAGNGNLPKATHSGVLDIGGIKIPCAVLADGRRLITQTGMLEAVGRASRISGKSSKKVGDESSSIIVGSFLKPFASKELSTATQMPVIFRNSHGSKSYGFESTALVDLCDAYMAADAAGALTAQQAHIAKRCTRLMCGFAKIGITALIDEATGYQNQRESAEFQKMFSAYFAAEVADYHAKFPREFYAQIHRLKGWTLPEKGRPLNSQVGTITRECVYRPLLNGRILATLEAKNPKLEGKHHRAVKHHQLLSEKIGVPDLMQQIDKVTMLMRISSSWGMFLRHFKIEFPDDQGQQSEIPGILDV